MSETAPNKILGAGRNQYPNQFFDLSQQYMPPTIKELFRWCTFYYYNSPLIGATIKKMSRYPITDLIFEDKLESVREAWKKVLVDELKMKDKCMEVNLDYHVYGNAFVSLHLPFTRHLICSECGFSAPIKQWVWKYIGHDNFHFSGHCTKCDAEKNLHVKDVDYKSRKGIKLIRWNPENISIKYNEYTGRSIYMYRVPRKLRAMIERGDKDIIEDMPVIVIEAVKKNKQIRLNPDALKHLKNPTLAEQDQGWGKPSIIHVLKDMFYFYTLRRAQEAIAMEHIVPFDMIYPMPNAQQDPYVHTDLGNWRNQVEDMIQKHRRDPNYKAVVPVPLGFQRVGGDGRAMMLSPELNYLNQTIVGGMGIPSEMLFGGLNFTGSSISLRMLENDFIQNRTQLLDLVYWIKDTIRSWLSMPDIAHIKFADFRMADDIQRNQQLVGLNAQGKLSNQTMLTELGFDYEEETQKILEETFLQNYLLTLQAKGSAKSQGESQIIGYTYQQRLQEMADKAMKDAEKKINVREKTIPSNLTNPAPQFDRDESELPSPPMGGMPMEGDPNDPSAQPSAERQPAPQDPAAAPGMPTDEASAKASQWAQQLAGGDPMQAREMIARIKLKAPEIGGKVEAEYNGIMAAQLQAQAPDLSQQMAQANNEGARKAETMNATNMTPLPEQKASTRRGVV